MLFKQRKVRRSERFSPRIGSTRRHRREYASSAFSTAAIQALISMSLLVAAVRSGQAIQRHASDLSILVKVSLPVLLVIGALFTFRAAWNNYRAGRMLLEAADTDADEVE